MSPFPGIAVIKVYHLVANGEFSSILTMAQMIQCLAFVLLTIKSLSQGQSRQQCQHFSLVVVVVVMIVTALVQVSVSAVLFAVLSVVCLVAFFYCFRQIQPPTVMSPHAWRQCRRPVGEVPWPGGKPAARALETKHVSGALEEVPVTTLNPKP